MYIREIKCVGWRDDFKMLKNLVFFSRNMLHAMNLKVETDWSLVELAAILHCFEKVRSDNEKIVKKIKFCYGFNDKVGPIIQCLKIDFNREDNNFILLSLELLFQSA